MYLSCTARYDGCICLVYTQCSGPANQQYTFVNDCSLCIVNVLTLFFCYEMQQDGFTCLHIEMLSKKWNLGVFLDVLHCLQFISHRLPLWVQIRHKCLIFLISLLQWLPLFKKRGLLTKDPLQCFDDLHFGSVTQKIG